MSDTCEFCKFLSDNFDMRCNKTAEYVAWNDTCRMFKKKMLDYQDFIDRITIELNIKRIVRDIKYEQEYEALMITRQDGSVLDLDISFLYELYLYGNKSFHSCLEMIENKVVRRND